MAQPGFKSSWNSCKLDSLYNGTIANIYRSLLCVRHLAKVCANVHYLMLNNSPFEAGVIILASINKQRLKEIKAPQPIWSMSPKSGTALCMRPDTALYVCLCVSVVRKHQESTAHQGQAWFATGPFQASPNRAGTCLELPLPLGVGVWVEGVAHSENA